MSRRLLLPVAGVLAAALAAGGLTLLVWTIDETPFARPDAGFDRLTSEVAAVPGVSLDGAERWVEAPAFGPPTSWVGVAVEEPALADALATACATEYADPVLWSFRATSAGGNALSFAGAEEPTGACPAPAVDASGLLERIDGLGRGLELHASLREGAFALDSFEDVSGGLPALLPIVRAAEDLRDAAGAERGAPVEISGPWAAITVGPGEQERTAALLTTLVEEHGVTAYWATEDGLRIVAPDGGHAAIEAAVRDSGLPVADRPLRFEADES
ncbi:hypothetical protein C5C52_14510 [Rathayibacter sp. AY1E5]|uniref:hypothetical protein n=1 Tax=Rathayibacter sp. AY1E5 TaxID=2080553 RepID=UPI000CE74DCB|nr:hypothetical protein [Rathayibacter sp. AY1E5]PPG77352.1 hypothetical protein C5C52_14510 [Rathayibacter sp. AY1E5]